METADPNAPFDPFLYYVDPHPVYRALRDTSPAYHNAERAIWVLSRFDDVQAAARDWETYTSSEGVDLSESRLGPGSLLDFDPPEHDQLRRILRADFAPARLAALQGVIASRAASLVESFARDGGGDFVEQFARRLPLTVVCDLLGVPERDHAQLELWYAGMLSRVPGRPEATEDSVRSASEMRDYIVAALEERRRAPRAGAFTSLAEAEAEGRIELEEVVGMCRLLLLAGIHTTSSLLANALVELEHRPDDRNLLAGEPARVAAAIEELLRFLTPVQSSARVTTRPVTLHGVTIPARARALLLWASANRDERAFADPDTLDLTRPARRNMAFGEGIHFCLGAPLARLETKIAFPILFSRIRSYRIAGPPEPHFTFLERGLASLPVEVA